MIQFTRIARERKKEIRRYMLCHQRPLSSLFTLPLVLLDSWSKRIYLTEGTRWQKNAFEECIHWRTKRKKNDDRDSQCTKTRTRRSPHFSHAEEEEGSTDKDDEHMEKAPVFRGWSCCRSRAVEGNHRCNLFLCTVITIEEQLLFFFFFFFFFLLSWVIH